MSYTTSGLVTVTLNNVSATTNPVVSDDETQGYAVQSRWTNTATNKEYVCLDPATGAAVWTETTGGGGGDVTGPGVAVDENIAVFNLTTGKIIKDGGINISAVTANTAKISYTDAAAVGLNTTHRGSDGKDHSDVVANNAKISYTDAAAVTANTARAPLSGAGVPGVSTGNGKSLGHVYVDTTNDLSYSLVDATTDANVWSAGGGGGGGFADAPDAALFTERPDHVNTPVAGKAELWVKDDAPTTLVFTDDAGLDKRVMLGPTPAGAVTYSLVTFDSAKNLANNTTLQYDGVGQFSIGHATGSQLKMRERSTGPTGVAANGHIWVKDDTPTKPMFTDDAGTEWPLISPYDWTPAVLSPLIWVRPDEESIGLVDIGVYTLDDTVTPSADGHAQPNNNAAASVTSIIFWDTNAAAVDNSAGFADFVIGDVFRLDDGLGGFTTWEINGTPVDNTTSWTYPVTNVLDDTTMTFPATSETVYMHRATTLANRGTLSFWPSETDITKMPRISSLASQPSLLFDGTDDEMIMTGSFTPNPDSFTIWAVFKNISSASNASVTNYGASLILRQDAAAGGKMLARMGSFNLDGTISLTGTHAFMLVNADFTHTKQTSCNFNDSETIQKRITGGVSLSTLSIGSNGSTFFNEMEFCESGITDRQMTADDTANLRQYILDRYGI